MPVSNIINERDFRFDMVGIAAVAVEIYAYCSAPGLGGCHGILSALGQMDTKEEAKVKEDDNANDEPSWIGCAAWIALSDDAFLVSSYS